MMAGALEQAVARIGAARTAVVAERVETAAKELGGVEVSRDGGEVTIAGRGLARRLIDEPLLRVAGSLAR